MHGFDLGRLLPPTDRRARSPPTARSIPRCRAATVHRLGAVGTNRRQPTTTLTATVGSVISMVVPRLEAKVGGQAQRRGLIPRTPSGERLLADATIWLTGEYPDAVRSTRQRSLESGATALAIDLHPAAPPLIITAEGAGRITVVGETAQAGPGYHRFVGRMLERLGSEIGIERTHGDGATTFADRPTVERAYLGWLGPQLTRARVAVQRGQRGVHVGMPPAIRVTTDAALATVLGPRAEAWLDSAIADPRVAIEITPWWADASDGKTLLNRALALMWLEVRWRPPVIEGESDVLDEIHRLLSRASAMDPDLDHPWHAWAQVCAHRGMADPFAKQAAGGTNPGAGSAPGLSARPRPDRARGLEPDDPRVLCRASDGGRLVGGHGRSKHHDRHDTDHDARRDFPGGAGLHRSVRRRTRPECAPPPVWRGPRTRQADDGSNVGYRGRRPAGLFRDPRLRSRHPNRIRRRRGLAMGHRPLAVPQPGLTRRGDLDGQPLKTRWASSRPATSASMSAVFE